MPEKNWIAKRIPQKEITEQLENEIGIDQNLAKLLAQRGISSFEEARKFFRPDLAALHDPFMMKDMDKAVQRIEQAITNGENILVYGDYDVDGTTAVSLVYSFLKDYHHLLDTYIPDRYSEGYGISYQGIDYANDNDVKLIIALDCGIKAIDKVDYANEKGIDFIICDHHNTGDKIPKAIAVLDPKRSDCSYPYKELSGCGIGFKLMQAFNKEMGGTIHELIPLLDLVAISIGADIVPITGENRTLAHYGLIQLNTEPRPGLRVLMETTGQHQFTITNVVFVLGPRINAAGRIEHGKHAVELLTGSDESTLLEQAKTINEHNKTRKDLDKGITEAALEMIDSTDTQKSTVVYHPDWHKGVIGIVASRLIEKHYRPTVVLTKSGDKIAGSARSVKGFDLYAALEKCNDALEQFGGHKYAAGMTLLEENLELFKKQFEEAVSNSITAEQIIPQEIYDLEVSLADITPKFFRVLKQFEPFGPGNLSPVFLTKGLVDSGWCKAVGEDCAHLKFQAKDPEVGTTLGGIAFGMGHLAKELKAGKPFDVLYHIEENHWNGNVSLQMMVKDMRLVD